MNPPTEEHLFEITLSQEGARNILRAYKFIFWLTIISIILTVMTLITLWIRYGRYKDYDTSQSTIQFLTFKVYPFFWLAFILLSLVNTYSFLRFSFLCKKGVETQQPDLFNHSFKWMARNAGIALLLCGLSFLSAGFELYVELITRTKA